MIALWVRTLPWSIPKVMQIRFMYQYYIGNIDTLHYIQLLHWKDFDLRGAQTYIGGMCLSLREKWKNLVTTVSFLQWIWFFFKTTCRVGDIFIARQIEKFLYSQTQFLYENHTPRRLINDSSDIIWIRNPILLQIY